MDTRKKEKDLTPEERALRAVRARRRFKAIVRLVIANKFWLQDEDEDDGSMADDVRRNVQRLIRKKGKQSVLTIKDKAILNKPTEERTEAEKIEINRVIGGLKYFRRYPSDVKCQLAAVTSYEYYEPGRVIIKQDDPPEKMYFILSGEVVVTQKNFDKALNEWITSEFGTMVAGTIFGEVSLLHGIKRTATITTSTDCEFLVIKKHDFDLVLRETVWKAWETIQRQMVRFSYFDDFDEVSRRECSILSKVRSFHPDDIILGDGCGLATHVYFVTRGSCYLLEHILLKGTVEGGVKHYSLYNPEYNRASQAMSILTKQSSCTIGKRRASDEKSVKATTSSTSKRLEAASQASLKYKKDSKIRQVASTTKRRSLSAPEKDDPNLSSLPADVEVQFVKICDFNESSCFNIGETFKRRRIVARTYTECLLIPRYWLMQKNKGNIWNRIQQFLSKYIPSTEHIFKEYLEERRWARYKRKLFKEILDRKQIPNDNSVHNVPYSLRLQRETAFDDLYR